MTYTKIEYDDRIEIENPKGNVIISKDKPYTLSDGEIIDAILQDSNFGEPQKSALRAAFGRIETEYR